MKASLKEMRGQNILITGGLGFIGSNIAHAAAGLGAKITIYDALLEEYGGNLKNLEGIENSAEFIKGDIRDAEKLKSVFSDRKFDYIFNCAAQVSHIDSMSNPLLDVDINCTGNINVLEAVRKFNDNVRVVYAGTRGQMGGLIYSPADEKHPDNPTDVYGANKLAAEKYHLIYHSAYGLKTTSIRINNTYGPRHHMKHGKYGILNWFIRKAMLNETIEIFGDGKQVRDYNYVDDVTDAMLLAAQSDKSWGEVFLLGSGKKTKFIDMVKLLIKTVGSGSYVLKPWPPERKAIEVGDFFVTFKKIKKTLGWSPKTDLETGLKKTVEFYKENNRLKDYT